MKEIQKNRSQYSNNKQKNSSLKTIQIQNGSTKATSSLLGNGFLSQEFIVSKDKNQRKKVQNQKISKKQNLFDLERTLDINIEILKNYFKTTTSTMTLLNQDQPIMEKLEKIIKTHNQKENMIDNLIQTKEIDDKTVNENNSNINNNTMIKNKSLVEEYGNFSNNNSKVKQINQSNFGLKKLDVKKISHLSIDCKSTKTSDNGNLSLISTQTKLNIGPIKENMQNAIHKSSKALENYKDLALKASKPKKIIRNPVVISKKSRNLSVSNATLYKGESTKTKSLFKVSSNISIHSNIRLKKSPKILSLFSKAENTKANSIINII